MEMGQKREKHGKQVKPGCLRLKFINFVFKVKGQGYQETLIFNTVDKQFQN